MPHSASIPSVPRLAAFDYFDWHCSLREDRFDLLTLSKISGSLPPLPPQYLPPTYALEFVVKGHTRGRVNNTYVELRPNDVFFVLADAVHEEVTTSPDCEIYVIGFTAQFAERLNIRIPDSRFSEALMRPRWQFSDEQMALMLRYIELLRQLILAGNNAAVLHLVRSLIYCLADDYALLQVQQTQSLTRAEQICGQFLSLVELHCRRQHTVDWYASQMCLSPKYLSNILCRTLRLSPNRCIDRALIRQAKSLLSSTSLSVQQISDALGFRNQSHFGRFFRRHTSHSPRTFRLQGM